MSDPNNAPTPEPEQPAAQQGDTTQPAYQATPQYQVPQTPVYAQPAQQYAQQGDAYAQQDGAYAQQTTPTVAVPLDQPYYGCPFTEAFVRFWKKYATFKGRASRSEFWWWILWSVLISLAVGMIFGILQAIFPGSNSETLHMSLSLDSTNVYTTNGTAGSNTALSTLQNIVMALWGLATIVPTLALSVRRLHDINKPGWWLAIYYGVHALLAIVMIAIVIVAVAGAASNYYYSYRHGYDNPNVFFSAVATGGAGVLICGILMLALWVAYIVFMALPSNPQGARFDAGAVAPGYAPGAYMPAADYAGYAGYAPNSAYAAPAATAPDTSTPAATAANYEQPAAAPVAPAAPTAPAQPEQPAADNNAQQPQQDQQ
ncbi:DUF805 domain-containing protein [Bifidobacterium panos]|uniref:DUF805 domain-containing protein n=1 Tax=Bifidobacterium panos TaxID=2675321 RepID=A0ABX1SZS7_9BIFI|nr:DUF805 domain-containing protein [Bifidobacterium sp. DSM 109963]NMN02099.1 hypothetical protein [Bifidobacterium sp. DSM 109963]